MATEMKLDKSDKTTLERLNQQYVDAFMKRMLNGIASILRTTL